MPAPSVREPIAAARKWRCRNSSGSISGSRVALDDDEEASANAATSSTRQARRCRPGPGQSADDQGHGGAEQGQRRRRRAGAGVGSPTRGCGTRWATRDQRHCPDGQVGLAPAAQSRGRPTPRRQARSRGRRSLPRPRAMTPAPPARDAIGQDRQAAGQYRCAADALEDACGHEDRESRRHGAAERTGREYAEPHEVRRAACRRCRRAPRREQARGQPDRHRAEQPGSRRRARPEIRRGARHRRHRRDIGDQDERGAARQIARPTGRRRDVAIRFDFQTHSWHTNTRVRPRATDDGAPSRSPTSPADRVRSPPPSRWSASGGRCSSCGRSRWVPPGSREIVRGTGAPGTASRRG